MDNIFAKTARRKGFRVKYIQLTPVNEAMDRFWRQGTPVRRGEMAEGLDKIASGVGSFLRELQGWSLPDLIERLEVYQEMYSMPFRANDEDLVQYHIGMGDDATDNQWIKYSVFYGHLISGLLSIVTGMQKGNMPPEVKNAS